jgi:hypothetical protein
MEIIKPFATMQNLVRANLGFRKSSFSYRNKIDFFSNLAAG